MVRLKERAKKYAPVDATALIMGETGTGKEMLAQSIHNLSCRARGPFVAVNCAALPEHLLESELFGYEEGAFTGARKGGKQGLFELAHGGTIFLDEIGEMPIQLQSRLLRVLQEKEVLHVGGNRLIPVDVRIIAATNRDLRERVSEGIFRSDLFYRLNILALSMPPLRERHGDMPLLVDFFRRKYNHLNPAVRQVDMIVFDLLESYHWPGNVRELEHLVERAMILCEGESIAKTLISDLLGEMTERAGEGAVLSEAGQKLEAIEAEIIAAVLAQENNNKTKAAKRLGIDRSTLWRKLRSVAKDNASDGF